MNYFELLKKVQDFRSQLEVWGISSPMLWVVGAVAVFFFVLSTREVLGWYLRTNQLRDEVRAMRSEFAELKKILTEGGIQPAAAGETAEDAKEGDAAKSVKAFRLDHWRNSL